MTDKERSQSDIGHRMNGNLWCVISACYRSSNSSCLPAICNGQDDGPASSFAVSLVGWLTCQFVVSR